MNQQRVWTGVATIEFNALYILSYVIHSMIKDAHVPSAWWYSQGFEKNYKGFIIYSELNLLPRLQSCFAADDVYLDHAGAALYGSRQMALVCEELSSNVLGNPHSRNRPSDTSTQMIQAARQRYASRSDTDTFLIKRGKILFN